MTKQKKEGRKRKIISEVDEEKEVKREAKVMHDDALDAMDVEPDDNTIGMDTILPTRQTYAEQVAVLLRSYDIVLIDGDVGCGKTFISKHVASLLNLPVRVMQMSDQLDSKSLLGSYECTEVAGHFKWKRSNFHEWLTYAGIIVIEDIDTGNSDVITSLLNISTSRQMILPTGDAVHVHRHCHLIATTQSTRFGCRRNGVLEGVHSRISLPQLTDDELKRLGKTIYPRIGHIVKPICKIFRELEGLYCYGNSRKLTSSDFMRALKRVNIVDDLSSSQAILLELIDVWCICEPSNSRRDLICSTIAPLLSLTKHEVAFSLTMRTPSLSVNEGIVSVGRVSIERRTVIPTERYTKFGQTRGALQLLERMCMSVKMGEAVLLVGESGVGKTSLVQVLADMRGDKLSIVNLGPHSDTDDLITSLRPTSYGRLMEPFIQDFLSLFTRSFDPSKNAKFLHSLEVYLMHQKYDDYLKVVEETAKRILSKRRKSEWADIIVRCRRLKEGMEKGASPFAVQRGIVKEAADEGYWLLIDEINLAPPECLDAIVDALSFSHHPSFRLFACMNPATDTSKRRLPEGIRSKFIEYYVNENDDASDLAKIVSSYLPSSSVGSIDGIVKLYMDAKAMYPLKMSLRTLTRSLVFAGDGRFDNENRCLYEAFSMAFLSNMEGRDKEAMVEMISRAFPCEKNTSMKREKDNSIMIEGYEIERGESLPLEDNGYVITSTVKKNLKEMARIVSSKRLAVLLEGETSAGKTSIVVHLARRTGNVIRRINNHEQTDVQEYLGSYVPDSNGRLVFREGPLVEAVRKGYWVILDELNLAPSDVIETLNRLLDDNRELLIPETNEMIKAHPRFRLFATQNPAGSYAGRKRLSRALLSRFVVLLFPILPLNELSHMVCARCQIAPSAANKMIDVLQKLRLERSLSGLFSSKDGLMTLRDVFRWGNRLSCDEGSDWQAAMLHHGFFLLAGRCRNDMDKKAVIHALQTILKRQIDEKLLFSRESSYFPSHLSFDNVILTFNMRRMLVLAWQAFLRNEAVLVVGETGDGKTRLAQTLGGTNMMTINCHERTECSDLLGRLRPATNGGFEWQDGVVISAMRRGTVLLMDEISLAEDSVLERLNPLFEEKRTILLTDSGAKTEEVTAEKTFNIIATMNPGGDYGKKELSKALRNRFTEIWSCSSFDRSELCSIFAMSVTNESDRVIDTAGIVIDWIDEFYRKFAYALRVAPSVRDIVACAEMWSALCGKGIEKDMALIETVSSVFIDGIPCQMTRSLTNIQDVQHEARTMMERRLSISHQSQIINQLLCCDGVVSLGHLSLPIGPLPSVIPNGFSLRAPTCIENMYRVIRALYINKPVLLEGSPGCGKSSLVMSLASICGYPITRLNLSEQTDLSDLFGSDVPIVDEEGEMSFEWKDGPILKAIKNGEWILLDEMNLASQSILEGLNACFDHRRVLYIAELAKEFCIPSTSSCRFFACQNPRVEGGNRRALPKSFVNRFTNIYTRDLIEEDELAILKEMNCGLSDSTLSGMVKVNVELSKEIWVGGPFSFNLRDINRWMHMISKSKDVGYSFEMVYVKRLRVEMDRERARMILKRIMDIQSHSSPSVISIDNETVRIGPLIVERKLPTIGCSLYPISSQSSTLLAVVNCLSNGWITLLVGPRNIGKRSISDMAAHLLGLSLEVISLSSDTDASELIGSFEQKVDCGSLNRLVEALCALLSPYVESEDMLKDCTNLEKVESKVELMLTCDGITMEVREAVKNLIRRSRRSEMYFEWVDSPFVRAYTQGKCILIENVNECNSAVLDRLNTSLEDGGSLVLSESSGDFIPIKPHPNFRVILSMDSIEGEISRAMRNRSVEIFIDENNGWNGVERDVHTMITCLSGKNTISSELSCALVGLPSRSILFSGRILSHYDEEIVAKLANRSISESCGEMREGVEMPRLDEWSEVEKISEWMLSIWKEAAVNDKLALPLLPLLSSSINMIKSTAWKNQFGNRGVRLVEDIENTLPCCRSNHPMDPSFHGDHTVDPLYNLSSSILVQWIRLISSEMEMDECSALSMSRSLSLYEMCSSPFYFNTMESCEKIMRDILESLSRVVKAGQIESESVFPLCISILSLLYSLSRTLSIRTGDSRIKITYSKLKEFIENNARSMELVNLEEWSVPKSIDEFFSRHNDDRVINPFTKKEEVDTLVDCIKSMREMEECTEEEEDSSFFSCLSRFARRIEKTLSLNGSVHHVLCVNTLETGWMRVMECLPWKNEELARNSVICSLLSMDLSYGVSLSSLLSTSPLSFILSSVWQQLGWDCNMSCLSVGNLRDLSLDSFVSQLWRIGANSRRIDNTIRKSVILVGEKERSSHSLMSFGLNVMEKSIPPLSSLDPVIYGEEYRDVLNQQMTIVEGLIQSIDNWRRMMGGQGHMVDETSTHPFLKSLYVARTKLKEKIKKMENGEEKMVYREECKQYSVMCREMHALLKLCSTLNESIKDGKWKDEENLELMSSHVENGRKSTKTYLEDALIRFGSLIDVIGEFWNGVWIVYLSLNMIHNEMSLHSTRLSLKSTVAFPRIIESPYLSWLGPIRNSIVDWGVRACSPLPIDLQCALIEWKVSKGESGLIELEWTKNQWIKWYEKNTTKENTKLFEYREKSMEEKEDMEMEEMFGGMDGMEGVVREDSLIQLLDSFNNNKWEKKKAFEGRNRLIPAIAYLSSLCSQCGVTEKWNNAGLDAALYSFSSVYKTKESMVNVYRETSWNEVKECIDECMTLREKTNELREKWPEVQSLSLIVDSIESLMDTNLSVGQMRMAEKLEKIIEEAEEWEKVSDRSHSLEEVVYPLRERLIVWKKMEIITWKTLVDRVKKDCEDRAALLVFPLFNALLSDGRDEDGIVAMASDWISHSSFIDFHQRLKSIDSLAQWARIVGKETMGKELESVVAFFGQLRDKVCGKLKEIVDPIERSMKDLVKIAQYKDLNILSIKASSKKNHIQLFKLVKRLKNEGGSGINGLMDGTMDIEVWRRIDEGRDMEGFNWMDGMGKEEGIVKRAREISKDILKQRNEKLDWNCWIEMSEMIDEVRKHCGTRIEYTGDEKEMESQQGRERNSRQREVAIVIKESQGLGVNSRRGMTVNGEDLSRRSLTQLDPSNHKRKNIIRAVALARSIMIRRGMTPNEQLSTSTRGHFLGMVEYGCHWMIENEQKMDAWKIVQKEMDKFAQGLRNEMDNREEGVETLYHNDVETTVEEMDKLTDELDQLIRSLKVRLTTVPSTTYDLGDDCSSPLSRLSSSSEELPRVSKLIDEFGNMNERILHQVDILHRNGSCGIFQRSVIENASQLVESVLDEWMGRMDECKYWFDEESEVMSHILSLIISSNKRLMIRSSNGESFSLGTDAFLLFIQRLHNNSVDCNEKWNGKGMDTLSLSAFTIGDVKPQEIVSLLSSALQRLSNGHKMDNIDLVFQLLCITRDLLNECVSIHDRCTHAVAITIHRMAELGIVLMEKGYVNTIPREEKTEGGEGNEKEGEGGEGGGMGEGKGCKDVTEEMEETGQIEGLQGDEEEENEGRDNGNNEKNDRPIEMEEDFAKDIEDVDREGESGDDNDDGEEGEDPPMDDGMGEVDDKDEEEIDPHLWDDKDKEVNEKPSMDDDNKGADEETGEMTAREDKNADMKEGEERDEVKDETNEEEKGEDDDIENMDKNDRDNMEDMDDIKGEEESRDDTGGDEVEEEQQMEIENKEVDVDENEDEDEEGENENEESEEIDENKDEDHDDSQISTQMTEELEMENKNEEKEDKKMDVGFGGSDNEDEDEGGKGERNEEERDKRDEEKGDSGREKSDDNKEGKTDKKSRKEENIEMTKKDEEDENEDNEDRERKREIMMEEDLEMEGESEIVEGNEEDGGEERMESMNRQHNDKMMMGGGSMEEAKESMKRHENKIENKKKENIQVNSKESGMEEEDEEGKECIINFNPLDLIALTDKLTKELVVGTKNETMNTMEAKEVKEQHEDQNIKCRVEWERIAPVVSILAAELSENLRLILEPRLATRMEGDYRTGKRLNMKKIIPYIASEYRKNRIWMRRTKKADRNYQVLIAVDDSASMAENGMETLTCQGVCIVEEALRRVNAGQLSVITFGETIEQLFPFSHASSTQSTGESLLSSLSFNQSSTDMCEMLRKACSLLEEVFTPKSEQMLIIISDGRGALANGVDKIRTQLSHLSRVSVLFVILDCGKKSIREMRVASFVDDQVELIPYLSLFPFPLYVLAQSNTQIPSLLAEALRQWIEYGSQHSN